MVERSAMNSFVAFEYAYAKARPQMWQTPGMAYDAEASTHNEITFCMFATWGMEIGLSANTVCTYVSLVKTRLQREFGFPLMLDQWQFRLPRLLKGIRNVHARVRAGRVGFRAVHHRRMRAAFGNNMSSEQMLVDALLATGRQCLARSIEMCPNTAAEYHPSEHMSIGDVQFKVSDKGVEYVQVWLLPRKKSGTAVTKVPIPLQKGDGVADAYSALKRYLADRVRREGKLDDAWPLFSLQGKTVTTGHVRAYIHQMASALKIDVKTLGTHSLRIGGATDHFVGGTPPLVLQVAGRWDSDIYQARKVHAEPKLHAE